MKCPHCNQEHPNGFRFCPITGKKLEIKKACTQNLQCPDYGKYILPVDSLFCPTCGFKLANYNSTIGNDDDGNKKEFTTNGIRFNMIHVEHGVFMMGATAEQGNNASSHEKPCHKENVKDFFMMESVVTQELWEAVMGSNPSSFKGRLRPVTNVSYHDCCNFIKKLNYLMSETFRLPTEVEWEYAARGGKNKCNTMYSGSDKIDEVAWYHKNSNHVTHNVKQKKPNKLGFYDMSGNVWEWCATKNHSYNGSYTEHPYWYINRGGCVTSNEKGCRTSRRYFSHPKHRSCFLGFRLAK